MTGVEVKAVDCGSSEASHTTPPVNTSQLSMSTHHHHHHQHHDQQQQQQEKASFQCFRLQVSSTTWLGG